MPIVELAWVSSKCCAGYGWERGWWFGAASGLFSASPNGSKEHIIVTDMYHCHFHNVKVLYYHLLWSVSQQPHKVDELLEYKNLGIFFCLEKEAGMDRSQALYLLDSVIPSTCFCHCLDLEWKKGKAENY